MSCAVPGCPSRKRKNADEKGPDTFPITKDPALLEEWRKKIPITSTGRRLSQQQSRVCALHFSEELLDLYFIHHINGQEVKIERTRPRLHPNAIPTKNLNTTGPLRKVKVLKNTGKMIWNKPVAKSGPSRPIGLPSTCHDNTSNIISDSEDSLSVTSSEALSFQYISDHCFDVSLPSTLWGIHKDPNGEYVAYTCMCMSVPEGPIAEKIVVFQINSKPKLYVKGRTDSVSLTKYVCFTSLIDIAEYLEIINKKTVCRGTSSVPSFSKKCEILVVLKDKHQNKDQCAQCSHCKNIMTKQENKPNPKSKRQTTPVNNSRFMKRIDKLNATIKTYKQALQQYGLRFPLKVKEYPVKVEVPTFNLEGTGGTLHKKNDALARKGIAENRESEDLLMEED